MRTHPLMPRCVSPVRDHQRVSESLQYRIAVARAAADADCLINLGCDAGDAGDHIDAALCFATAVELGDEQANFNLGNELVALGRDGDAVAAYERAIAVGVADAFLNLGAVLERLGDLAGALRAY